MKYAKLAITVMLGLILSITAFAALIKAQGGYPPYHAGYFFYNKSVTYAFGVSGKIYTINPEVPATPNDYFCQWVTVMISYKYGYWIQLGYLKSLVKPLSQSVPTMNFYIEIVDEQGPPRHIYPDPVPQEGITYTYKIIPAFSDNKWKCIIEKGAEIIYEELEETNPFNCVDLQAFSETSMEEINIDGTHFSKLSYFTGRGFPLWNHHVPHADPPYYVEEITDYEFYAYGGG